uniref:Putative peter pan protein n=1 Tax=Trypanosoma congolense (strain IL3000) TaxID=1068625 RepID=G0UK38_TRYCI|nr:putative peter pan protein [Trypanosoma congolense IL3000]
MTLLHCLYCYCLLTWVLTRPHANPLLVRISFPFHELNGGREVSPTRRTPLVHMGKSKAIPGKVDTTEADKATPKSIIIYRGEVGNNVRALMHDWRAVFLPWSSRNLRGENRSLKDFLVIASSFSVSHLQLFTAPSHGTSLRIMRFANGPTLSFRVLSFTLRDEIVSQLRRPVNLDRAVWDVAPIVVLNNFTHPDARCRPEVPLLETTFKGMFPTVNIQLVKNSDIQRVCLFHYDHVEHLVEVRHYYINAKAVGLSKTVKKLLERRCPTKLGRLDTMDELLDREDAWSDTDGEGEEVPLAQPFRKHRNNAASSFRRLGLVSPSVDQSNEWLCFGRGPLPQVPHKVC